MNQNLLQVTETFFLDYVKRQLKVAKRLSPKYALTSKTTITHNQEVFDIYFQASKALIQYIAFQYMQEEITTDESIQDFFCELSNIVSGMFKTSLEGDSNEIEYTISIPKIIKQLPKNIEKITYKIENKFFVVASI